MDHHKRKQESKKHDSKKNKVRRLPKSSNMVLITNTCKTTKEYHGVPLASSFTGCACKNGHLYTVICVPRANNYGCAYWTFSSRNYREVRDAWIQHVEQMHNPKSANCKWIDHEHDRVQAKLRRMCEKRNMTRDQAVVKRIQRKLIIYY